MTEVFIIHHNPNNGRYGYAADPTDAIASARALLAAGEDMWVAGNCRRMIRPGNLLLFKFGGAHLQQEPGLYAAAHVTRAPTTNGRGVWALRYKPDQPLTRHLIRFPIVGSDLARVAKRSFGASIQVVRGRELSVLAALLGNRVVDEAPPVGHAITHGLLIKKVPLDKILAGTKTWEIRGKATARRGPIALMQSRSGQVVGTCEVVDVVGPLSLAGLNRNAKRTGFRAKRLEYGTTYAWVLRNAGRLPKPVPYRHPPGAVIWVKLQPTVIRALQAARAEVVKSGR